MAKPAFRFAGTLLALAAFVPLPLAADPVEDFYKGKQIRIITGAVAGDGYDLWSRMLARHMGRHIPGRPSMIVQNMPGAGTVIAANHVYSVAPKDGTVIGSFSRSLPAQALLGRPNIKYDPRAFGWVGSPESINRVCAVGKKAKAQSIDDLFVHELVVGGIGPSQMPTYVPMMLTRCSAPNSVSSRAMVRPTASSSPSSGVRSRASACRPRHCSGRGST